MFEKSHTMDCQSFKEVLESPCYNICVLIQQNVLTPLIWFSYKNEDISTWGQKEI